MKEIFAENLRTIRSVWNKTQASMAEFCKKKKDNYVAYENATNVPPIDFLLFMEEKTGISARRLWNEKIDRFEIFERPRSYQNTIAELEKLGEDDKIEYRNAFQLYEELKSKVNDIDKRVEKLEKK